MDADVERMLKEQSERPNGGDVGSALAVLDVTRVE